MWKEHNLGEEIFDPARHYVESTGGCILVAIFVGAIAYISWVWPNVLWYAFKYSVSTDKVHVYPKPTDCDFWHAPVGFKDCHYEKLVWAYSAGNSGSAEYRYDLKTGQLIDLQTNEVAREPLRSSKADPNTQYDSVSISWVKKSD